MIYHSTTIVGLTHKGKTAMGGDGQVTLEDAIVKSTSSKVRKMYNDMVLVGFAGAAADAFTLFERFEAKLSEFNGNLSRASVELAKDWRTDKYLRRLEALLACTDGKTNLILSGNGDVIEPDEEIAAIGSGGPYALAAARALMAHSDLNAESIAVESMKIAASICLYTNEEFEVKLLPNPKA